MSYQPEYFVAPRAPGVRPADPPDYNGITFVYLFTRVLDPWIVPPQLQNVVLVVDNAQGFVAGMSIIIEGAGSFEVVSTDALNRMTVQNLGYSQNAAPGTGIAPGKITTTSLPGPKGDSGPQGVPGPVGPQGATGLTGATGAPGAQGPAGSAFSTTTSAAFNTANAPTIVNISLTTTTGLAAGVLLYIAGAGYYQVQSVVSGTAITALNASVAGNAAPGTNVPSGSSVLGTGPQGPIGATGPQGSQGPTGNTGTPGATGPTGAAGAAATVAVGTTTTGAAGSNATVTNSGSSSAAVLNFTVPQGIAGAQGPTGATGSQGTQGPAGPSSVSANANNKAALGSDSLILVQGTAAGVAATTHSQTVSGDDPQLTNARTATPHGPTHIAGDPIPLASASAKGLLAQVSGNTTDYVGGDNACHPLTALLPPGTILDYAGSSVPTGYLACDGTAVSRTTYAALYTALGSGSSPWGQGNGSTTFNVPDLRSRLTVGVGQGTGLTNRVLAATGGEETHVLALGELAAHTHSITDPTHLHNINSYIGGGSIAFGAGANQWAANQQTASASTGITGTNSTGSGTAHNTMPPFAAVTKIIKT